MKRNRLLTAAGLVCSFALVSQLGCGPSANAGNAARVSGRISYKGQPVKGGNMYLFSTSSNITYNAMISADGTYQASDVGTGEVVVVVETESLKAKAGANLSSSDAKARLQMSQSSSNRPDRPGAGSSGPAPGQENAMDLYVKIPAKYGNQKTSPLTLTLKPGRNVQDIDLTD